MTVILGIDPGMSGAWAVVSDTLLAANDFPLIGTGKQGRIHGGALADEWRHFPIEMAVIEQVSAMPKQGVSSTFRFGYAAGQVLGVVEALNIPIVWATPARWKREARLSSDKEDARKRAIETWPERRQWFARKKDHGRAEAALLALWAGSLAAPTTGGQVRVELEAAYA